MQVRRIGYRVKGLYRVARLGMKWGMIAPNTEKRLKILRIWEEHGLKATRAAFEVSRRTLFDWKHRFKAEGARGLAPGSTRPKGRRERSGRPCWSPRSAGYGPCTRTSGARSLRCCSPHGDRHRGLLFPANVRWGASSRGQRTRCAIVLCASTPKAARSAGTERAKPANLKGSGQRGRGQCVGFDSIERFREGLCRYLVSVQDECSRIGFALAVPGHGSLPGQPRPLISPKRCCRCVSSTHFMITARSSRDSSPRPPRRQGSPNGIRSREHPK